MKMTKEEYDEVKREYEYEQERGEKKKPFKLPWKKRRVMAKSKKPDQILVFLLNLKKQIEGPILTKIYGGNFLVIRNHVYRYNPDRVLSFGKFKSVIAREYDRELVGVDDYQELMYKDFISKHPGDRINIQDPVLIKALIQARLGEKQPMKASMKWIIIALVILGIIIGFFYIANKNKAAPVTPPTTP
jgi:hypothetical protein